MGRSRSTARAPSRRRSCGGGAAERERLVRRIRFLGRNCITSTVIVRREALDAAAEGGAWFDESMPVMEDIDLWTRLAERSGAAYHPEPAVRYRRHPGGLHLRHAEYARCTRRLVEKARARRPDDAPYRRGLDRFLSDALSRAGLSCLRRGDPALARSLLAEAVRANPPAWRACAGWGLSWIWSSRGASGASRAGAGSAACGTPPTTTAIP